MVDQAVAVGSVVHLRAGPVRAVVMQEWVVGRGVAEAMAQGCWAGGI